MTCPFTVSIADALRAHKRQPDGRVYVHLTDDPEPRIETEEQAARRREADKLRKRAANTARKRVSRDYARTRPDSAQPMVVRNPLTGRYERV